MTSNQCFDYVLDLKYFHEQRQRVLISVKTIQNEINQYEVEHGISDLQTNNSQISHLSFLLDKNNSH